MAGVHCLRCRERGEPESLEVDVLTRTLLVSCSRHGVVATFALDEPMGLRPYDVYDSSDGVCRHCRMAGGGHCQFCWRSAR